MPGSRDLVMILTMGSVLLIGMLLLWVTSDPAAFIVGFFLVMVVGAVYVLRRTRQRSGS
jgi:Flp pilus assembly protein TadB